MSAALTQAHARLVTRVAARPHAAASPEAGFSVVLVVASILILLVLGLAMVSIVVEDSDLSVNQVRSNQAFYAAHAGVEYAVQKLAQNPSWTGLASPGKNVGVGSFWIAPPDGIDENGNPLPAGRLRVVSNGVAGGAARQIQVHVTAGGISTYAGTGTQGYSGDGGAATAARLNDPEGAAAVAANGDLYLADTDNSAIRKIAFATGIITTVAGTGSPGYTGDGGAATSAKIKTAEDVAIAANGDIYIADTGNHVIRKVTAATGVITTVAGNGSPGSTGDGGAATAARLNSPRGIQIAANGDLYIGDRSNEKIRKVTAATGVISTYAGTGTAGYSGDGGAATAARLNHPQGLHLTSAGDLYFADANNHAIRKISAAGVITTFAGTGTSGYTGNGGLATSARLNAPEAVHLAPSGDVYIADTGNNVIRKVAVGSLIISTIAGTVAGFAGDGGPAASARLDSPRGLAIAPTGIYYIADKNNHRIRRVAGALAVVAWVETRR